MKKLLLLTLLLLAPLVWAALADVTLGDIMCWGLVRRAEAVVSVNRADPIIADLIRELKQSIVTTLWQAPRLAPFIGLDSAGVAHAESAEAAFDFHLRKSPRTRARITQCVDVWEVFCETEDAERAQAAAHAARSDGLPRPDPDGPHAVRARRT